MLRAFFIATIILSFIGIGVIDCAKHNWRTGVTSILLAVVQLIIFGRPVK